MTMYPIKKITETETIEEAIKQAGGILPVFEVFYLESIKYAADRANVAFKRFKDALPQRDNNPSLIVASAQEALTHTGTLSKFFWPVRDNGISFQRGRKLCKVFGLTEASPLKSRDLRNTLEHFDEKLDIYLKKYPTGAIFPDPQIGSVDITTTPIIHVFRMVDTNKLSFVLFDKTYEFGPLVNLIEEILVQTEEMIKEGGRFKSNNPSV
ncbi:MAG: hypothetical protein UX31_C0033G0021 [Candidatus Nomurabacteria bacterium GW2011_GWA1_46_11]|uniref:Uncharacterized protein n=1 Tax=Candidatus Nomurabacteria bacterium GW2011_GWA1_46_11 TaxID=1618732 RepID=A0A0G1QSE7_9BACT|nr:MAG: hypothetical protein UX31_C0033G0021 [Candidatus Nomurabacteria bacterium GW2011_GWA1_46_11]